MAKRPAPDVSDRRRQARAAQLAAIAKAKRRRKLTQLGIVGGVAVLVIAIVTTAVLLGRGGTATAAPTVDATVSVNGQSVPFAIDGSAIRIGPADAKATIDLWVDYSCSHCQDFEEANGDVINGLVAKGNVAVRYHQIQIVTDYGLQAGSASACVAVHDPSVWVTFNRALYSNHGTETDGWTAGDFGAFAAAQGAGTASQECIGAERYVDWIGDNTAASTGAGVKGTPAMFLDGQPSEVLTGQALVAKVDELAAA